ncbi:F0F1 ATP synthase subunit B [Lachnospiraceae bacterium YH-ros2228]|jgi:F-type H+-transporting ATPase subunit b|nr:F0F1 ATP synthase subunit B [Lachnospiraceae bacterium]MDD6448122.1 F0F1 ATP synthase subunit B [Lachnospiraceae bacterium]MDD6450449.1 F0F1 ATP synthase subunit B [Lachnospiraceae bacterium]MDD6578412.1 F0F1 ATP synthase subunit B [Lachnospiraceae bacterium]
MLDISFPSILFTIINILFFAWIMKKFLFQRVMNVINERQKHIEDQFAEAEEKQKSADQARSEYETHLKNAKIESQKIMQETMDRAEAERQKQIKATEDEISEMKKKAANDLLLEQEKAKKDLQADISRLAVQAARKILMEGQEGQKENEGSGN